jgi:hypothetical protein
MSLPTLLALTTQYDDIKVSIMQLNAPVGDGSMKTAFWGELHLKIDVMAGLLIIECHWAQHRFRAANLWTKASCSKLSSVWNIIMKNLLNVHYIFPIKSYSFWDN